MKATVDADSKPVPISTPQTNTAKPTSLLERRLTGKSRTVSLLRMREVCGMSTRPVSPSGPGAIWDHEQLNKAQFVQLLELFVGREPAQDLVDAVAEYIKTNYIQAEKVSKNSIFISLILLQDKVEQRDQAQLQVVLQAKRRRVNLLFDTWDNDSSGFLELEELQVVLNKWSTEQAQEQGKSLPRPPHQGPTTCLHLITTCSQGHLAISEDQQSPHSVPVPDLPGPAHREHGLGGMCRVL